MRRTAVLQSIVAFTLTALGVAIGACASSEPVDGNLNGIGQDNSGTQPVGSSNTSKLPPSNPPADTTVDAGTTVKDAATAKDSSTSTPVDSGTPPTSTPDCDPNDPLLLIKIIAASGASCPCSASECCFSQMCLPN